MKVQKCKYCELEIVFLKTKKGKFMPVDYSSLQNVEKRNLSENIPVIYNTEHGHISHFGTCPNYSRSPSNKRTVRRKR